MYVGMAILKEAGKMGMINMQSWMFLSSFEALREHFLTHYHIDNMLHLGPHTFDELGGEVVQNTAFVCTNGLSEQKGDYFRLVDFAPSHEKEEKYLGIVIDLVEDSNNTNSLHFSVNQDYFDNIPGMPIGYWVSKRIHETFTMNRPLSAVCKPTQGLATADNGRFIRSWFEVEKNNIGYGYEDAASAANSGKKWFPCIKGGGFRRWYGNLYEVINWENDGEEIKQFPGAVIRNEHCYYKECISWNMISSGGIAFRYYSKGFILNNASNSYICDDLYEMLGTLNSKFIEKVAEIINPTINLSNGVVARFPYMTIKTNDYKSKVIDNINTCREDWDAHETSWDFKKNDLLRVLVEGQNLSHRDTWYLETLMEYYKTEWEGRLEQLHKNEEELNRQFIEIYGLQDELTPDVPLNEVTILQQGEISIEDNQVVWHEDVIIKQLISYIIGCYMGRYRLDREGLAIAHPNPTAEEIAAYNFTNVFGIERSFEIDVDGLIPALPSDSGFADNALLAVRQFIQNVFGDDSYAANLNYIENCLGKPLEDYLFKDFWNDHKKMYQNRPIYWLFSSKKGAFKVLAYCHRMTRHTAEQVRQKYLLPYIDRMKGRADEIQAKGAGATAAERRQLKNLTSSIAECEEYHTRLHAIADQQIAFDLDDGVVHNYALFGDVLSKIK